MRRAIVEFLRTVEKREKKIECEIGITKNLWIVANDQNQTGIVVAGFQAFLDHGKNSTIRLKLRSISRVRKADH